MPQTKPSVKSANCLCITVNAYIYKMFCMANGLDNE